MATVRAHEVAEELRRQLPGIASKKLHKLLYYCQGHHLTQVGEPLFAEPIMAWDMGPVVANLWKAEREGVQPMELGELDNGQLNTIADVVSRYGQLTGADLERLTHAEDPWRRADVDRPLGESVRIELQWIQEFFAAQADTEGELSFPTKDQIAAVTAGADQRRQRPAVADDPDELRSRLATG